LNGKKVEGGRLGKYFASTIGAIVGSHFGPLAAVVGAELGSRAKGAQMSMNKIGKAGGKPLSVSDDMLKAEQQAQQPRLALPPGKQGTPGNPAPRSWIGSGPAMQMGDGFKADAQAQFIGQSSNNVGNRQNIQPATTKNTSAPSIPKTIPKPKKKANPVGPLPGTFKPSRNIAPGDTPALPMKDGTWPTTASKPSKGNDTSTGNAPIGKEGVSAQRADTSGPFDDTIQRNEPNTNLGDSSNRGGIVGRALGAVKEAYKKSGLNDQRGFIKNPLKNQYPGEKDLTSAVLDQLEGKTTVSKRFIEDLTNQPSLRQAERDLVRQLLKGEGETVSAKDFANRVKTELLPLKTLGTKGMTEYQYENVTLPDELRGPIANYTEHVYESPISTTAGEYHFHGATNNYFAHSRIEDLPPRESVKALTTPQLSKGWADLGRQAKELGVDKGTTRRVIEIQSDLFQKGRLENEFENAYTDHRDGRSDASKTLRNLSKLEPYRNTWHERIISEEVRQAAKDKKTKLQFPVGETAMKIEGLGAENSNWTRGGRFDEDAIGDELAPETIKRGETVNDGNSDWIITDVLGDGKFKAVYKEVFDRTPDAKVTDNWGADAETFDISGKVDTSNPIFRFYEKEVGKYLTNRFGAKRIKDERGVEWFEVNITKDMAERPVNAFTGLGMHGFVRNKK
jgi:hypothetical protein